MPSFEINGLPTPSLLDRLGKADLPGEGPAGGHPGDSAVRRKVSKAQLRSAIDLYKDSVKRDLEWLLNTRQVVDNRLGRYPELSNSVFAYGLPDISSVNVSSVHAQNELLRRMERCIERFDKRLANTEISLDPIIGSSRVLRFTISGIVLMDPAPEEILIDMVLDPAKGEYEVK